MARSKRSRGGGWSIYADSAARSAAREAFALERQHRQKWAKLINEQRARDRQARLVGAALRRAAREAGSAHRRMIHVSTRRVAWKRDGGRRCLRIETMTGLAARKPSHVGADGRSSFHFRWRSRGVGGRRSNHGHAYRRGEAVRHLRYILRLDAREITAGGIVSNISGDLSEVAGVMEALEELAYDDRANSNVYVSIVIALPHELTDDDRTRCLANICSRFEDEQLPYIAVLHDPDPRGDERNDHAHLMVSLRPFKRDGAGGFAFAAGQSSDLNDKAWIWPMRCHIADCLNRAMIEAGEPRRFTPLSNAARGLPPSSARGKDTPGQKHRERRAEDIAAMHTERQHRAERQRALEEIRTRAVSIAGSVHQDVAARLAAARTAVAGWLLGRRLELFAAADQRRITLAGLAGRVAVMRPAPKPLADAPTVDVPVASVDMPAVASSQPVASVHHEGRAIERTRSTAVADFPGTTDDDAPKRDAENRDRVRAEAALDRWPILPFDRVKRRDSEARDRSRRLLFPADDLANDPEIAFAIKTARSIDMTPYLRRRWGEFLAAIRQDRAAARIDARGLETGRQVDRGPYYRLALGRLIDHPDVRDVMAAVHNVPQGGAETVKVNARATALRPVLAIARSEIVGVLLADDRRRLAGDLDRLAGLVAAGSFEPAWACGLRLRATSAAIADEVTRLAALPEVRRWLENMATALGPLGDGQADWTIDRPAPAIEEAPIGWVIGQDREMGD